MKRLTFSLALFIVFGVTTMFAQTKKETVTVYGNCASCEKRIETAANAVPGISDAAWSKETKKMAFTIDTTKTNKHIVQLAISKVGHDTEMHRAKDDVYNALPSCCKYERAPVKKEVIKKAE